MFDVEVTIKAFLADASASTLELPNMTPSERKDAKRIAEAHNELSCESFGFGADRKLMLLKRQTRAPSGPPDGAEGQAEDSTRPAPAALPVGLVKIKNTFIDDWDMGAGGSFERALFSSMPAQLLPSRSPAHVLPLPPAVADDCDAGAGEGATRSLYKSTPSQMLPSRTPSHVLPLPLADDEDDRDATPAGSAGQALYSSTPAQLLPSSAPSHMLLLPPSIDDDCDDAEITALDNKLPMPQADDEDDRDTNASGSQVHAPSDQSCLTSSPPSPPADTSPDGAVEIRNTFIHIQSTCADQRIVQSMPHGMFAKALLDARVAAKAPCAKAVEAVDEEEGGRGRGRVVSPGVVPLEPAIASAPSPPQPPAVLELQPAVASNTFGELDLGHNTFMVIEGLCKSPEFNGCLASVQYFEADTGRYSVIVALVDGRQQQAKVKRENLRHVPSPYHFLPGCSLEQREHRRPDPCRGPSRVLKLDAIV